MLPDKTDVLAENMELFHSYVRGGIELMYEQFTDGCTSREDYHISGQYFVCIEIHNLLKSVIYIDGHGGVCMSEW